MNDLLFILGFVGIAYYIYSKHLEIEKYKYQVALIVVILCMYYVTVSNELFEGFPQCQSICSGINSEDECENKKGKGICKWNDKTCKAKSNDKCSDKSKDKCLERCTWKTHAPNHPKGNNGKPAACTAADWYRSKKVLDGSVSEACKKCAPKGYFELCLAAYPKVDYPLKSNCPATCDNATAWPQKDCSFVLKYLAADKACKGDAKCRALQATKLPATCGSCVIAASHPRTGYKFQDCIPEPPKKKNKDEGAYNQQRHEENYDSEDWTESTWPWILLVVILLVIGIVLYKYK